MNIGEFVVNMVCRVMMSVVFEILLFFFKNLLFMFMLKLNMFLYNDLNVIFCESSIYDSDVVCMNN